jgi:hypothetical protein
MAWLKTASWTKCRRGRTTPTSSATPIRSVPCSAQMRSGVAWLRRSTNQPMSRNRADSSPAITRFDTKMSASHHRTGAR